MKLQGDNSTRYPYYVVHSPNPPHSGESRTFGFARRRLLFAIIPIMFKMGVMMTMLVVLMFLTLKSVAIGSLLLFIATVSVLSRIKYWLSPSSPPVVTPVTTFSSSPVNAFVSPVNAFASPVNAFASPLRNAVLQSEAGDGNGSNIHVHIHMNESQGMHWGTSSHIPDPASSYPPMVPMPDHTYAQNPYPYPPARDTYLHPPSGASMWSRQGVDGPLSITGIVNGSVDPSERVAVVTGANKGLGFGIVKSLCEQFDGYIYLTARDKKKGAEAVQVLKDRASTVPFAIQAEKTILTNYLGLVRTCVFLFPLLRRHARVVNLSSSAGHLSQITNLELKKRLRQLREPVSLRSLNITKEHPRAHVAKGWPDSAYAVSKIGVNLLTRIYQKKFDCELGNQDKVINAVHPGYVATNMSSFMGNVNIFDAAKAPLYCALLPPHIKEPRGQLVWNDCSIMDIDSPTTPPRPEVLKHDNVTHVKDYVKVYSVSPGATAELPVYCALLPPNIRSPRGELVWSDYSEVDLDSPTTPETNTDINHYDIYDDIRDYINYTSTSRFPPWDPRILDQEDKKKTTPPSEKSTNKKGLSSAHGNHSARAARSVQDTTKPFRTITRPTLPEQWVSYAKWVFFSQA
ncbi:uncharacterized protein LOC103514164 [Diaphorina citri]|uniref:Uncharacterized protein LOC103514164 n=1 Tax=Diaphorina citri TaxID=121845 RepID=A0A3Q0J8G2_DIACI|nr:uncharacterized protein LOC103514164 [Diaphorina citri]